MSEDNQLLEFANEAYFLGYVYRLKYESQVEKHGEVRVKYNLLAPENIWQLFAAFGLGGVVGNLTYDAFKAIGRKLIGLIKRDKTENEFRKFIEIVSDDEKLKELFSYIQAYYYRMPNSDKRVSDAIYEEKLVDIMTSKMLETIKEHKESDKHIELPSKEKLKEVLINLKK